MNPIFKFSCSWLFALFLALGLTATSCTEEEPELYGNVHGYVSDSQRHHQPRREENGDRK